MEENSGRRRILIIAGFLVTVLIMIVVIGASFLPQISQSPSTESSNSALTGKPQGASSGKSSSIKTKVPSQIPPEVTARSFYGWYVNTSSPIKSGAYKERGDLTSEFKQTMGIFVSRGIDPGYDHVFCEISSLPKDVLLDPPEYNEDRTLALVMFKDASARNLFQMKLESINGKWLVSDVWCPASQ